VDAVTKPIRTQLPSLIVSGLLVYFAVAFGLGGAKTLLLLHQGATDYTGLALARATGHAFDPTFDKLVLIAAVIGGAKLAIASFFVLAVTERSPAAMPVRQEYDAFDAALSSASALTLILALPAWVAGDAAGFGMHVTHAALMCVAIAASIAEREHNARDVSRVGHLEGKAGFGPQPAMFLPFGRVRP
jgi:hypothetical protein